MQSTAVESPTTTGRDREVCRASPSVSISTPAGSRLFSTLGRDGVMVFGLRVAATGIVFLSQMVLARALGMRGYGEFAYALTWMHAIVMLAKLGQDTTAIRYASEYRARQQRGHLRGFVQRSLQLGLVGALCASAVLAIAAWLLRGQMTPGLSACLLTSSVLLPIITLTQIPEAILRGTGHIMQGLLSTLLWPSFLVIVVVAAKWGFGLNLSPPGAMLLNLFAAFAACLVAIVLLRKAIRPLLSAEISPEYDTRAWMRTAFPLMLIAALTYAQIQCGMILCGLLLDPASVGLYAAVWRISSLVLFGIQALNVAAAPRFAALHATGDREGLQRAASLTAYGGTCFALVVSGGLVVFGRQILELFGEEFTGGYLVLIVLLGGPVISAAAGSVGHLLNVTGNESTSLRVIAGGLALNLVLCLVLIPLFGTLGAAMASTVAMAICNIVLVYFVRQRLNIWSWVLKF